MGTVMSPPQLAELQARLRAAPDAAECQPECMWRDYSGQLLEAIGSPDSMPEPHLQGIHEQLMEERTPAQRAQLGEAATCNETCAWREDVRRLYHHVVTLRLQK